MKELPSQYNPKDVEDKIYRKWEKSGFFNPDKLPGNRKKSFTIVMAPPNITGHIHIGHALENTLSDVLIRKRRMEGYKTLFMPGKDHAGIAAQYVVERELRKENKTRFDLGKEGFLERMRQWMKENGDAIDQELKSLGLSCDWSRKRFTMDKHYQQAVRVAFEHYYKKGWIYRGKRIVNWCSRCQTAISDLEMEYTTVKGKLWYIRYPIKNRPDYIVVATTRPETMLGDAAVAVKKTDPRYRNLVDESVILPIQEREIPIIADSLVDHNFGTGALKVTPAHDAIDFNIAEHHKLPAYIVINEQGRMTEEAGPICVGLKTTECREKVVLKLKELGLLEREEEYEHNIGRCERCQTIIEPLLSEQWFLSMKELAQKAIKVIEKDVIKFYPSQRKRIFVDWLNQVYDWNISRQLWWGHKIPLEGENDVLDTWFSSALWPFATLGWPEKTKDFRTFYPTDTISSAREIFFLWIVRMTFSGIEFTKKIPFRDIYTHATVLDSKGRKMSKSIGNTVDPLSMIKKYGTDALRFGLVWQITGTQDIHWNEGALVAGKKFANKIWNASRFVLAQLPASGFRLPTKLKPKSSEDKKILAALEKIKKEVNNSLDHYEFGKALHKLYDFFWHTFCDKYLEKSKMQLKEGKSRESTTEILLYTLADSLKLLHPFMPFIAEEIWSKLPLKDKTILLVEKWPN